MNQDLKLLKKYMIIISGLQRNTSIIEIHFKCVKGINLYHLVHITSFCHQLEEVHLHRLTITKAEMSYILMQLHVKEVTFWKCTISEEVAQVAVDTLRSYQHPFFRVYLFEKSFGVGNEQENEWKYPIMREIYQLTWSNNFRVDCNHFINGLSDHGTRFKQKLESYSYQGHVSYYDLLFSCCRNRDKKLWYAAIMAAVEYNKHHTCFLLDGEPNMLYSLIREYPNNLKGV